MILLFNSTLQIEPQDKENFIREIKDGHHSGRPSEVDNVQIKSIIDLKSIFAIRISNIMQPTLFETNYHWRLKMKWNNINRKRSWFKHKKQAQTILKAELHQKKIRLAICWYYKVVYILSCFQASKRSTQVFIANNIWEKAIKEKRPTFANAKETCFTTTMREKKRQDAEEALGDIRGSS